jgi:hypothetical protein
MPNRIGEQGTVIIKMQMKLKLSEFLRGIGSSYEQGLG